MGVASAGTSGFGGRPVLPRRPRSDRSVLLQSAWAQQHKPPLTSEPGRHGTWDAVGNILPDSKQCGRAACSGAPALSACFHRTLFSLERQADMAAQTQMCDRRFLKKGRGTCLSRETTNSICCQ